ncbi:MAG: ATP-dependent RNA helicase HrpA [bacterium]
MVRPLPESLAPLLPQLEHCMAGDRHRLRRRLFQLAAKPEDEKSRAKLVYEIETSTALHSHRQASPVVISYPEELPVSQKREQLVEAIKNHQVILVCGETGSGKTTQLPKLCLEAGRGRSATIGHTQPRRLAASAVSARLAEEMQTTVGEQVGFKVRFSDKTSPETLVKVMTDGILLAEIQQDRWLNQYDTLIIDEAHERSLNIDFLLGYLKQLLKKRRDLKLIITSATIDAQRIAQHFGNAPIVEVSGRSYPVDILYRPLQNPDSADGDLSLAEAIDSGIEELQRKGRGDILVFLPGEREIREISHRLRHRHDRMEVLPLYARLPASEQRKIFHPQGRTRVVLSTNVAETSLTVPGIRYVIDAGTARVSRYSWRSKVQRLPIEKISQASANQRSGRCGRLGPGVCIRLYDEEDFANRPEFTDAEILRTNLASVILQMAMLRLGSPEAFPFIDSPDPRLIRDGYRLLEELQAVDRQRRLTALGKQLGKLPIDPRFGRMLLAAADFGATREVLTIVTALTVQDPRERPYEKRQAADEHHSRFNHPKSDFVSLVHLWSYLEERSESLSQNKMRKLCGKEFISYRRWREWRDTHRQLKLASQTLKLGVNDKEASYENLHRALLTGLLDQVGEKSEKQEFLGCRGRKFQVFPGSSLAKKPPKWVMAAEITETTRLYARTAAAIQPDWIEQLGTHLLSHHYSEPHWVRSRSRVGAYDRLSLYGLVVAPKKPVNYAAIDAIASREIFIRHALVMDEYKIQHSVLRHNRQLIDDVETLEAKSRRRDILIDEEDLYRFYDSRLPENITSGTAFEQWYKKPANREKLRLKPEQLKKDDAPGVDPHAFPDTWVHQGLRLPLSYHFEPGSDADGVTLTVPLSILKQIDEARIQWLVPGLIEEKIQAMIRALPKGLRKNFVPAPDFAKATLQALTYGERSLPGNLSRVLHKMTGIDVSTEAWDLELEPHLMMRLEVIDPQRKVVASGRHLGALLDYLKDRKVAPPPPTAQKHIERSGITHWEFGELPEFIECKEAEYSIQRYPALCVEKKDIALRLFDTQHEARHSHEAGVRQLLLMQLKQEARYLDKNLPDMAEHCLKYTSIGHCQTLKQDLLLSTIQQLVFADSPPPRSPETFQEALEACRAGLVSRATEINTLLGPTLQYVHEVQKQLKGSLPLSWIEAAADIRSQLQNLVYDGFLLATPAAQQRQLPRYMEGIKKRLEKLSHSPDRDRMGRVTIEPLQNRYQELPEDKRRHPQVQEYRWLLEELRISIFAQELGTQQKVSPKRLDSFWKNIDWESD